MIALQHQRTPALIPQKYRGNNKLERDISLMTDHQAFLIDSSQIIKFSTAYWAMAKKQLKKESHGKCAYCEADTAVVAHGDVEHYRPKSIYWWLAYTYDNYLYACQICNQTYKSDNFPIKGTLMPAPLITDKTSPEDIEAMAGHISPDPLDIDSNYTLNQYIAAHQAEQALLINPYLDDPDTYFAYSADDITREVTVVATEPQYADYIRAAEKYYGINRLELRNARYAIYEKFKLFKLAYLQLTDASTKNAIKRQLDEMCADKSLFAGMNRYFESRL